MLQKLKFHLDENFSFLSEKKLLIAISGGIDSVVLFQLLNELQYDISLAHCNFKLREKESDLDEELVKNIAKKSSKNCFTTRFNTLETSKKTKQSTQVTARNLRYQWFNELIEKYDFDYVLTAHHADDNLETFLINLSRGSGLDGFTGIPKINGKIARPLLVFSREEIEECATKNNLEWREDKSNVSSKYLRNKIRHQIVPILKEINPNLLNSFAKTIKNLQESKQLIEDRIFDVSQKIIKETESGAIELKIDIEKLKQLSNPKAYLFEILKKYHFTEWNDIENLLTTQTGKFVFSETHQLLKNRKFLILNKRKSKKSNAISLFQVEENSTKITDPIHLKFEKTTQFFQNKNEIQLDKNTLHFPLIVRKWQQGDYFYPTGMTGKKKLSKFFKDEKISLFDKENIWLLCNQNNDIIWVIGKRLDRRFEADKTTKKILKITLK